MEAYFKARGAVITHTQFAEGEQAPDPAVFDLLVIMGGPMGVYEENLYPWLQSEKAAIRFALKMGKPILGICLGAQLVAEVLGGTVTRNREKEIGWWPVERLSGLESHWAASCFPERFQTFHWHGDTFSIPPGAVPLFRSEGCDHQGFAFGDRIVGLQFHPEILPEVAETWIQTGKEELASSGLYIQKPAEIRGDKKNYAANNDLLAALCEKMMFLGGITELLRFSYTLPHDR